MSIKVMSAVWEMDGIDGTECLVMLALADHADDEGRCYPSIRRLADRSKLSERGVQKVIGRLIDKGFVSVVQCGGRRGANLYIVSTTPEPRSPPNDVHPRTRFTPPLNHVRETPEPRSPEPSRTIIEPSEDIPARDPAAILCEIATPKAVKSFLGYRRKIRKPVSEVAAERIAKTLTSIANQGGSPDDALGMAEEKGWQSIKAEWYFKEICNEQSSIFSAANRQMARGSQHGGGKPLGGLVGAFVRSEAARGH